MPVFATFEPQIRGQEWRILEMTYAGRLGNPLGAAKAERLLQSHSFK